MESYHAICTSEEMDAAIHPMATGAVQDSNRSEGGLVPASVRTRGWVTQQNFVCHGPRWTHM